MRREEYDFEAELAQSVSAIVNNEFDEGLSSGNSDTIVFENLYEEEDDLDFEDLSEVRKEHPYTPRQPGPRKHKKKSNVGIIVAIASISTIVIIAILVLCVTMFGGKKVNTDTYEYQSNMGMTMYESGDYESAAAYFNKALEYYNEADHVALRYYLHECEMRWGNPEKALDWLNELLNYDAYNIAAITRMAEYYDEQKDADKLNELILKYTDTPAQTAIEKYLNAMPGVSHCSGSYSTSIEVSLFNASGNEIHYTLDGTIPNAKDTLYTGPIVMEKGTNRLKAVCVSPEGLVSDVLECEYIVTYTVPEMPIVSPGSGAYESEQIISVDNFVNDGSYTAYYTLDGSTPTKDSPVYTGPIDMPAGNNVFTVVFLSKDGISSSNVKRNYNLKLLARYTFDEALTVLQQKMQKKGELSADVNRNAAGEEVRFVYYRKQSIDDKEMYLVNYDIRRDGSFARQDYLFGVDNVTGKCYIVTNADGVYKAEEYK